MVISMTGFGRSKKESDQFSIIVEIKTVNHRFSEFHIRMPRQFLKLEDKLKKELGEHIRRGRAEVFVTIEGQGSLKRKVHIDWDLLDEYYQYILNIQEKYSLSKDVSIQDLLNRDEFMTIEEVDTGNEELENLLIEAVGEAALLLKQMRLSEGTELQKDLETQLMQLQERIEQLRIYASQVSRLYEERLTKRLQEYLSGQVDEARIITEVAIFADKADINEELTRLDSHIKQFRHTLTLHEAIGRKLDFLLQEMNREVNTIGSKANDSSIAKEVVEMKSLLEKMKEQVQNVE